MFRLNKQEQINLFDKSLQFSSYEQKLLDEGWPGYFKKNVFPKINEEHFSVLYSDKASRPNNPVNVTVGLLILKELNGMIDAELMQSLIFDIRYQYALCTTGYEKQPVSKNAFTNFRNSLIAYELSTGIDLFKEEMLSLSKEINDCCETETTFKRMDSMMISSSCKSLSRIDLAYKVNVNLIEKVNELDGLLLNEREKEYLEKDFKKSAVYETTKENQEEKLKQLLEDTKMLYNKYKEEKKINELEEFKLLERLYHDQIDSETGTPKASKDIKPDSLQNPSDPDATYRFKYGNNVGYVGNVVEEIHENGEIYITDYQVEQNTYSDKKFMEDYIEKKEEDKEEKILVDAAYYSEELNTQAKEENIELIPTQTMGKKSVENNIISDFKIDEETHEVLSCPNNEAPISTNYNEETHKFSARFDKSKCENCPLKELCENAGIIKKRISSVSFTEESHNKATLEKKMGEEEYKRISNKRAGIEGTMSVLRRKYNVDKCPSKGKLRLKIKFGGAILSININKAIKYRKNATKNNINSLIFSLCSKIFRYFKNYSFILVLN